MAIGWTKNAAGALLAGFISIALGFTAAAAMAVCLFAFALLCGLDLTSVARVKKKDPGER